MRFFNLLSIVSLLILLVLCVVWEMWIAPLRPGGSMLVLKSLPLLFPVFGILHGKRYTHQWTSFLALAYFTEGIVRAVSDMGISRWLGAIESILAVALFVGCLGYAKVTASPRPVQPVIPAD